MEFNEVVDKRRTSREWTDEPVAFEAIKRIIEAGMKAPPHGITTENGSLSCSIREKKKKMPSVMPSTSQTNLT